MPDIVDAATELEQEWVARSVAHAQRALSGAGLIFCEACEAAIPPARREAHSGATRCAPCQQRMEERRRGK